MHVVCWFCRENCTRGWRLFNLVTGFFPCSNTLLTYCARHLEAIIQDANHPFQGTVSTCGFRYTIWLESYLHLIVSRIAFLCLHWVLWISYLFTELASVCLKNLRRSLSFGGRRHIPSHSEMEASLVSEDTRLTMLNRADESMWHCFFCSAGWKELPSAAHKAAWWKRISLQDSQL